MNLFKISFQYLLARPLNTFLNMLILSLGVAIITILLLVSKQIEQQLDVNAKGIDLVVGAKGSPLQLILSSIFHIDYPTGNIPLKEAEQLAQNPMVKYAIPLALGDSYNGFRIVGTNTKYSDLYGAKLSEGNFWKSEFEVCLGSNVAKALQLKVGDTFFGAHGMGEGVGDDHEEHAYKVVGVLQQQNNVLDRLILTSVESIWHSHKKEDVGVAEEEHEHEEDHSHKEETHENEEGDHDHEEGQKHIEQEAHSIDTTRILSSKEAQQMILNARQKGKETGLPKGNEESELTSMLIKFTSPMGIITFPRFINQQTSMQAASPAFEVNRLFNLIGIGFDMLKAFAYLMVFIAALSIFIALYNALKDRKYDLAVMRSMGASKARLFFLVILESNMVTIISTLLGILLGHLTLQVISAVLQSPGQTDISGAYFLEEEFIIIVSSILLGFITALISAMQAYKTNISEVLSEG